MKSYKVIIQIEDEDGIVEIKRVQEYDKQTATCSYGWHLGVTIGSSLISLRESMVQSDFIDIFKAIEVIIVDGIEDLDIKGKTNG